MISLEQKKRNFRHLYADIFWFGVLSGSAMAFLAVYVTRLGGSGFQISLLTAGPALINLAYSLPAGRLLERRGLVQATFWTAVLHRLGYLAVGILPWLLNPTVEIWGIVAITLVISVPGTILAIAFNALFADAVPPEDRGTVVGRRNALLAASMAATTLISGQLLNWQAIPFPLNYQLVFLIGFVGAAFSTYHISQLRLVGPPPVRADRPIGDAARPGRLRIGDASGASRGLRFLTRSRGKPLLRLDLLRSAYGSFLIAYLVFYIAQYFPIPLFPLAFVHSLHLSDAMISLGNALFQGLVFLGSMNLARITTKYGYKRLLVVSSVFYGLYPLLIGLAKGPVLFYVASLSGGFVWALTGASLVNRLMERTGEAERPAYMALHNLTLNLGILLGSLSGPWFAEQIGLPQALLLGAGMRMLSAVFLALWG